MFIRKYQKTDSLELFKLFSDTIHSINSKDYPKDKLDVWIDKDRDLFGKKLCQIIILLLLKKIKILLDLEVQAKKGILICFLSIKIFKGKVSLHYFVINLKIYFLFQKLQYIPQLLQNLFLKKEDTR